MTRKHPRLHIRFEDHNQLDQIELWAHKSGTKIAPWARRALIKQARIETVEEKMNAIVQFSALETLAILREMAGPESSERARRTVKDAIKAVKKEDES